MYLLQTFVLTTPIIGSAVKWMWAKVCTSAYDWYCHVYDEKMFVLTGLIVEVLPVVCDVL